MVMISEVLKRAEEKKVVYEVIGISKEQYDELFNKYEKEFKEILKTGRFVEAGIKLLKWLGFKEEDITTDDIVKAVIVMKTIVYYVNKASRRGWGVATWFAQT